MLLLTDHMPIIRYVPATKLNPVQLIDARTAHKSWLRLKGFNRHHNVTKPGLRTKLSCTDMWQLHYPCIRISRCRLAATAIQRCAESRPPTKAPASAHDTAVCAAPLQRHCETRQILPKGDTRLTSGFSRRSLQCWRQLHPLSLARV